MLAVVCAGFGLCQISLTKWPVLRSTSALSGKLVCLVALVLSVILFVEYTQFVQTAIITPLASEELFRYVSLGCPRLGSGAQANKGFLRGLHHPSGA